MKLFLPFLAFSLFGSQRLLSQVNDADKASFEKKFDAKIVKVFDTDNPAEGLAGGTSIAVAYSGSDGTGQKYGVDPVFKPVGA